MASMAPVPGFCPERKQLTTEFTIAVSDYNHLQSKQLRSLTLGLGFEYASEIKAAAKRKDAAKQAILKHDREHGC
jgi:hypothetical protein